MLLPGIHTTLLSSLFILHYMPSTYLGLLHHKTLLIQSSSLFIWRLVSFLRLVLLYLSEMPSSFPPLQSFPSFEDQLSHTIAQSSPCSLLAPIISFFILPPTVYDAYFAIDCTVSNNFIQCFSKCVSIDHSVFIWFHFSQPNLSTRNP